MYYAIEGIKGSGKSAVFECTLTNLRNQGLQPTALRPTAARTGSVLDALHVHTGRLWPDWLLERLYARRSNIAAKTLDGAGNRFVLGERSVLTSYVSRWCATNALAGMARVDRLENLIPLPQHVIYLNVPIELALRRIGSRSRRSYGLHHQTAEALTEANRLYNMIARDGAAYGLGSIQWHFIDASQELGRVCQSVVATVTTIEAQSMTNSAPDRLVRRQLHPRIGMTPLANTFQFP